MVVLPVSQPIKPAPPTTVPPIPAITINSTKKCNGLDVSSKALLLGYISTTFRGIITFYMLLSLKDNVTKLFTYGFDYSYGSEFSNFISLLLFFGIATMLSVCFTIGIKIRNVKYMEPYILLESFITLIVTVIPIYSFYSLVTSIHPQIWIIPVLVCAFQWYWFVCIKRVYDEIRNEKLEEQRRRTELGPENELQTSTSEYSNTTAKAMIIGYSTLVFRTAIALVMLHSIESYLLTGLFRFLEGYSLPDFYDVPPVIYCIPIFLIYFIAALLSASLIYGIRKRNLKYIYPYLAFDLLQTMLFTCPTIFWIGEGVLSPLLITILNWYCLLAIRSVCDEIKNETRAKRDIGIESTLLNTSSINNDLKFESIVKLENELEVKLNGNRDQIDTVCDRKESERESKP